MRVSLLLLAACGNWSSERVAPPVEHPDAEPPLPPPVGEVVVPQPDTAGTPGAPVACAEDIFVALAGNSGDVPVLADVSEEAYGAAPVPKQVHLSWSGDPSTTMSVVWRTDAETKATRVQLGPAAGAYTAEVEGRSFELDGDTTIGRVHEARICGLPPGSTWHYRVGGDGSWSQDYTFTTAPPPGTDDGFVFGVTGDTRGDPTTWGQILAAMANHGVEFRLFTGDAVDSGSQSTQWDAWFAAGEGTLPFAPLAIAHGNHEGLAKQHFALFALPGNEQWYSFDYGNAHFVFVNDTPADDAAWDEQIAWLTADLAASTATWKILVHHKPAWSSSDVHAEDADVKERVVPVAEVGGVHLDLSGHNHHYERSVPLRQGALNETAGIVYVVTAGGGAPLYTNDGHQWYTEVAEVTEHYVIVRVQGNTLTSEAYDLAGNLLDTVTLGR